MKKHVFGRQFKRDANERKALFKNLLTSLVLAERIETTEAKAKAIKADADKLITKAKIALPAGRQDGTHAFRMLEAKVNHNAVVKLIEDLGPRFAARNGGYTRIIKTRRRVADNAPMVILEWVERASANEKRKTQNAKQENEKKKESKGKKETKETKAKKIVKKVEKKEKVEERQ